MNASEIKGIAEALIDAAAGSRKTLQRAKGPSRWDKAGRHIPARTRLEKLLERADGDLLTTTSTLLNLRAEAIRLQNEEKKEQ